MSQNPRLLIIYSNPPGTPHIRLDKEHRRVDLVLQRVGLDLSTVQRLHATSIDDLINVLYSNSFEIVQFSGHGTPDSLCLENTTHDAAVDLSASKVAQILRESSPRLRAAMFLWCYSADALPSLAEAAPFVISIHGPANDEAAIDFIGEFYESYFRTNSIEQAFGGALMLMGAKNLELSPILTRRAEAQGKQRILYQVFPKSGADSILIDITDAEQDIARLDMQRDTFLTMLSRKIRIHRWIFESSSDQAVLSIGRYIGMFSWENAADVVKCDCVLRLRADVDERTCELWAGLLTLYNDHRVDRYRLAVNQDEPTLSRHLKQAIEDYYKLIDSYFKIPENSVTLRLWVPEQYLVSRSLMMKYLEICDRKYYRNDYPATVEYLEAILSALHDLVNALTSVVSDVG